MADDTRKKRDRNEPLADEAELAARLRRLGERLGQHQPDRASGNAPGQGLTSDPSALARGFRLSAELVGGVLVGAAIGWLIDHFARSSPWGLILFVLLGFTAGVLNVMRAAGVLPHNTLGPPES